MEYENNFDPHSIASQTEFLTFILFTVLVHTLFSIDLCSSESFSFGCRVRNRKVSLIFRHFLGIPYWRMRNIVYKHIYNPIHTKPQRRTQSPPDDRDICINNFESIDRRTVSRYLNAEYAFAIRANLRQ